MGINLKLNMMLTMWKAVILSLVFNQHFVFSQSIDDSQLNKYVSAFHQELESHIDKVLAYQQIQQMLQKAESDIVLGPINGAELFSEIYQNISFRYNDVVIAAKSLKNSLENITSFLNFKGGPTPPRSGSGAPPPMSNGGAPPPISNGDSHLKSLTKCCCGSTPLLFDGRLRDFAGNTACYGEEDTLLKSISKTDFISILKQNYETMPGITWQYFADSDGHYIQYPANDRACDKSAPPLLGSCGKLDSPLTKEWYVEKLHMERKNLVILLDNSIKHAAAAPPVNQGVMIDAVSRVLATLTPQDKVNIVASPSSSTVVKVPTGCRNGLFVATETNLNKLRQFTTQLTSAPGEPDLLEGLRKVYTLLESEKTENEESFKTRTNLVLILMNGKSKAVGLDSTAIFEMIAQHQRKLEGSGQHFIYTLGKPTNETVAKLAQVADQNNLKLDKSSGIKVDPWPQIPKLVSHQSIGLEGVLEVTENQSEFVSVVSRYFQRLPPQVDTEMTTITPVLDDKYGLGMTVAVPVYDGNQTFGVVAVDGSLATIFSEIVNFDTGTNSYMYVVDSSHGHVLLHPKLRDPAETRYKDIIFPRLELLEADLSDAQRKQILTAGIRNPVTFDAQVKDIHPEIDGELVTSRASNLSPATVYSQKISGTNLFVVLVLFKSDVKEPKLTTLRQVPLHGIYHRLDLLSGAPGFAGNDSICHLHSGHFLSFKQSVVKFSPSVFKRPEIYKYSNEDLNTATKLNMFISGTTDIDILNNGLKSLVFHSLYATDGLDALWTGSARDVIERFYGSSNGVFRVYPGAPMMNTFDHRETDWYKRSVSFPSTTMYHRGKLSLINRNDVIIISRAVHASDSGHRLQGVVGMTVTPRFLISQLFSTVKYRLGYFGIFKLFNECFILMKVCSDKDHQCRIIDGSGNIIDSLGPGSDGHLSKKYPWVSEQLVKAGKLKVKGWISSDNKQRRSLLDDIDVSAGCISANHRRIFTPFYLQQWCTGFSDGYHKVTLTLTEDMTFKNNDPCQQFWLRMVNGTNLFILIIGNRENLKCDDLGLKSCSNCKSASFNPIFKLSIPKCDFCSVNITPTTCQCTCYCDKDLDECHGQFNNRLVNFPTTSCFYAPTYSSEFKPDSPGPMAQLDRCPIPCVAIEDLDICNGLAHCKVSADVYPTCIWKDEDELKNVNISRFFPTTTPPRPPMGPSTATGAPITPGPVSIPSRTTTPLPLPPLLTSRPPVGPSTQNGKSPPPLQHITTTSRRTTTKKISPTQDKTSNQHTTVRASSQSPVTGSSISMVTDGSTMVTQGHQSSVTKPTGNTSGNSSSKGDDEKGLSGGAIAALVIGLSALVAVIIVIGFKIYHKKFRRAGADDSAKYRAGSSMFDSTVYIRSLDQVSINAADTNTSAVPYQEMTN